MSTDLPTGWTLHGSPYNPANRREAVRRWADQVGAPVETHRRTDYIGKGDLNQGLRDASWALSEVAHLVADAAKWVETGSAAAAALETEAERITQASARVDTLAREVEAAE